MQFIFSDHVLDTDLRELRRGPELVAVEPQVFDLLAYLMQNRDHVVSKDELIAAIWAGRIVSESTLTSRINAARRAVGDNGRDQKLIRTIIRRGLRFVGQVHSHPCPEQAPGVAVRSVGRAPGPTSPAPSAFDRPTIAVFPFTNMSGDAGQDYFSEGIAEDLIIALSKSRWFQVIARNSSFIYKGKPVHMTQVAEELGVNYLIEGSVRKDGDRVRITAKLDDVATGSHLWAERYDGSLTDVFAVQDEIAQAVAAAIEPQLISAENFRIRRKAPDSMDAWELVMRALPHHWRVTRQDCVVAQHLLQRAIAIAPDYGQALGVLAASHVFSAHMGWTDMATGVSRAEHAALAAVRADGEDPWAHYALASTYLFARRFDDSLAEFDLALQLNPSFSPARGYYGRTMAYCGRWQDGDLAARHAMRLSPRDPFGAIYCGVAAYAQFVGRNYSEAIRLSRQALRQRSDLAGAHRILTAAAALAGMESLARSALQELRRAQPNISLEWIANQLPFKLDVDREHYLDGFRRAGLD